MYEGILQPIYLIYIGCLAACDTVASGVRCGSDRLRVGWLRVGFWVMGSGGWADGKARECGGGGLDLRVWVRF